jgi:type 1 glutamine amidotransferase
MIHRVIPKASSSRKRVLLLHGGWRGHAPAKFADFAERELLEGYDVVRSRSLDDLTDANLKHFDLILPIWTFGSLTASQQRALLAAVHGGLGYVGWHGNASSFLECRPHKLLLGGQFVAHPGGNRVRYTVSFHRDDNLVSDLADFTVVSEQYYLLIDPAIKVLATTSIRGGPMPWLNRVRMPVAWKRCADQGRVFYCALGHTVDVLRKAPVTTMLRRALAWASRGSELPF